MRGQNVGMEDTYYACIPERMTVSSRIRRFDHDIWIRRRIDGICVTSDIVSRVIDSQCLASIDALVSYAHCSPFFVCKLAVRIRFTVSIEFTTEDVVF